MKHGPQLVFGAVGAMPCIARATHGINLQQFARLLHAPAVMLLGSNFALELSFCKAGEQLPKS
jgi:hypothetical protein